MTSTGEKIHRYRKLRGMNQGELAAKLGMTEGAVRHYESDARSPKQPVLEEIADALGVSPLALKDFGVDSARSLMALFLELEDDFGLRPARDGRSLEIDPGAPNAPKTSKSIEAWAAMRERLESGEIAPEEYEDWKSSF